MMSNRGVRKQKRSLSIPVVKPNSLLAAVLTDSTDIPSYLNYTNRGFPFCEMSPLESSQCIRCMQSNRSGCNIIKVILFQFQNIVFQYIRLESELEKAFAKVSYLQQQKKL